MQSSTSHSGKCQQVGENGSAAFPTPSPKRLRVSNPSHPTTTTNDDSTYDFDNEEEEWETASLHYLKATLVGVYCASCTHQPLLKKRGSNLFLAHSTDILRHHWKNNKCYTGCMPNAERVKRELMSQQVLLHSHLKNNNTSVRQREVEKLFPQTSPRKAKSPEQIPPNPVNSTEFLPYVPPNLTPDPTSLHQIPLPFFAIFNFWIYFLCYNLHLLFGHFWG